MKPINLDTVRALSSNGLYCWLVPTNQSMLRIQTLCREFPDLKNLKDAAEFHTTVLYSRICPPNLTMPDNPTRPIEGVIDRLAQWTDHKGRNLVVALVESDQCKAINQHFVDNGCKNTYEDYTPHITLAYSDADFNGWLRLANLWLRREGPLRIQYLPVIFGSPLDME